MEPNLSSLWIGSIQRRARGQTMQDTPKRGKVSNEGIMRRKPIVYWKVSGWLECNHGDSVKGDFYRISCAIKAGKLLLAGGFKYVHVWQITQERQREPRKRVRELKIH